MPTIWKKCWNIFKGALNILFLKVEYLSYPKWIFILYKFDCCFAVIQIAFVTNLKSIYTSIICVLSITVEEHFGVESPSSKSEYGKFLGIPGQGKIRIS